MLIESKRHPLVVNYECEVNIYECGDVHPKGSAYLADLGEAEEEKVIQLAIANVKKAFEAARLIIKQEKSE